MNNKQFKYRLESKYILLFASIIIIILMFLSYKFNDTYTPIKNNIAGAFVPMEKGINTFAGYINKINSKFDDIDALQKENESLSLQLDELQKKYNDMLSDSYELENLRALFQLAQTYSQYETVGAKIIATDSSGFNSSFTIDKGTKEGICPDMNVIAGNGLVGIVVSSGDHFSVVQTIIDDNSNVSANIVKSDDACVVNGSLKLLDEGYISVSEIPISSTAANNYQVVTSALSSKYLPDILIGYISNVTISMDGLSKEAYLTPVVDFTHLDTVLVITTLKENVVNE